MNDHVPLRVTIHGGRPHIMAAHAIVSPKLFAAQAHVGIARDCAARLRCGLICLRPGKHIPTRTHTNEHNQSYDMAAIPCHIGLSSRNPWLSE